MRPWILGALIALAASGVWLAWSWQTTAAPHEAGDWVGGHLGVGVGAAGTILFFAALLMQRDELSLQRLELRAARTVNEKQEQHAAAQVKIARDESARRILGQLLEMRFELTTEWPIHRNEERDLLYLGRLVRLSLLVQRQLARASFGNPEKYEWRLAFGPWEKFELPVDGSPPIEIISAPWSEGESWADVVAFATAVHEQASRPADSSGSSEVTR